MQICGVKGLASRNLDYVSRSKSGKVTLDNILNSQAFTQCHKTRALR